LRLAFFFYHCPVAFIEVRFTIRGLEEEPFRINFTIVRAIMHYLKPLEIDFTFNKAIIFNKDIKFIKEPFKVDFTVRKAVNLK
jgi:hypothetical protein